MNGQLKAKLQDKKYRDAYVAEHLKTVLASQIQTLRHKKRWTQTELARRLGTTQNVVSRLEDPDYGKFSLQTLMQLASAFDVALFAKFVSFNRFEVEFADISPAEMMVSSFTDTADATSVAPSESDESEIHDANVDENYEQPQAA